MMLMLCMLCILSLSAANPGNNTSGRKCDEESVTEVSGTKSWQGYCVGDMIFYDNFDDLQLDRWKHEEWDPAARNGEFQAYVNSRENSYVEDSILHIKVTTDADEAASLSLKSLIFILLHSVFCTDIQETNHIHSARMQTASSFSFKYGIVEIRAKMPAGDWLWPAMWLLPKDSYYGSWPLSGEIDLVESRGNRKLTQDGQNIGVERAGSTLHFGPKGQDAYKTTKYDTRDTNPNYADGFHVYKLEWTKDHIKFIIDDKESGSIYPSEHGFYEWGHLSGKNPWGGGISSNFIMAPFDQQFYIILNVAVGGTNGYFSDSASNPDKKPWKNSDSNAAEEFWNAHSTWLSTWNGEDAHMLVDYVKVFAV